MTQISRLKDAEISNGNLINADDLDSEFNQLVSEHNANDTILTNATTGTFTFSGVKTFSSTPKMNAIDERTAGSGVTADGVRLKDGMVKVAGTPTENGEIGYASNALKAFINGSLVTLSGLTCTLRVFTSSGTWTKPSGLVYANVTVIGGGGGGGGRQLPPAATGSGGGGGGGGGGMSRELILAATLGATESYAVGAGGTPGSTSGGNGGTGGTSSFGTSPYLQATGGIGGAGNALDGNIRAVAGGGGGIGSNGDINAGGSPGEVGIQTDLTGYGGGGGSSFYGGGAAPLTVANDSTRATGTNGSAYGGGGSGGVDYDNTGTAGGSGAAGVVIVEEYTNA
jgi:hypothetical protein